MKNIIYSKYSNERANKFKIRTDILEDLDGNRFVQKVALTPEAQAHIDNIYNNYNVLSQIYRGSKLCINKCHKAGESLEFEYIYGKTLVEELDELLFQENYIGLFERINQYVSLIQVGLEKRKFELTEDFISVFGNVQLSPSIEAAEINNIDFIFNNIIVGKQWYAIDYEWTFNFPVPFNYIIYRAIRSYIYESHKRNKLKSLGLYKLLGIADDEIALYDNMEKNFQDYVSRDFKPLYSIYGHTTKTNINVEQILEEQERNFFKNTIQIFFDYGQGFSEESSYKILPSLNENGNNLLEIDIKPSVKKVRVDPANSESIVIINSIVGYTTKYYDIDYYTNGIKLNNTTVLFTNNDPQIVFENIEYQTSKIQIDFSIQTISNKLTVELCKFIEEREEIIKKKERSIQEKEDIKERTLIEKEVELNKLQSYIVSVQKELDVKNNEIIRLQNYNDMILNSTSWKITKPIRYIGRIVKKIL